MPRITAVLGPTNTGKTYLAVERMLGHRTGMMGFPLRLLARENYDRVVKVKGEGAVALITGEEKIVPARARYFICTVESMPTERLVAFLAVDEIQLCADPDRGHIFTERLLHARGMEETMFLGAETIASLIRRLVPEATVETRPRFSELKYGGAKKLTRLPPRSAVVAFSANDVYAIAETVRRHRGGAAVVMGALSPRTRNAQVALYQNGEVDYLVATDAIGMGLNMDVDHVSFAALRKFDGRRPRPLDVTEIAQIAGRAGRHMNDGTFGPTTETGTMDADLIKRVENHDFPKLRGLFWRNGDLHFSSIEALKNSLARAPDLPGLAKAPEADDVRALHLLAREEDVAAKAVGHEAVGLLWDVCQIPDYGKIKSESHARLLHGVFAHLSGPDACLPTDWVAAQVERVNRTDGDIETLTGRIAGIRTWTYAAHRSGWLKEASHWQERTRAVEDRLSDALHQRLTQRFVDVRTSVLVQKLKKRDSLIAAVAKDGRVMLEGHVVGHIEGLKFLADESEDSIAARAVAQAAGGALKGEISERIKELEDCGPEAINLDEAGTILWRETPVGRVVRGADILRPEAEVTANELLEGPDRERVRKRLTDWLQAHVASTLEPLSLAQKAEVSAPARGIAFRLIESLGQLAGRPLEKEINALTEDERKDLSALGIRFGVVTIYMPAILKPAQQRLKAVLFSVNAGLPQVPAMPPAGRVSFPPQPDMPPSFYEVLGYCILGGLVVRVDMVERFAAEARRLTREGPAVMPPENLSILGIGAAAAKGLLGDLGFILEADEEGKLTLSRKKATVRRDNKKRPPPRKKPEAKAVKKESPPKPEAKIDENSPFAKLRELKFK